MPTRTVTLASNHAVVALIDVDLDSPQTGRVVELRVENNSRQRASVRFRRSDGKGHITDRVVAPGGVLRATPGAGLDVDLRVTIDADDKVSGAVLDLERITEDSPRA